jgi:primosomal protein N' (replication factor Y)
MEASAGQAHSGKPGQGYPVFSPLLKAALEERLKKREQSLLFLNRRGYFPFLLCEDCGQTPECLNCSISLTYHRKEHHLKCHACDFTLSIPETCPGCHGTRMKAMGMGTERVEAVVRQLFPQARVIRMDRDTTRKKAAHGQMLDQMQEKQADILIGTQMITKGLDFPDLTLVGVILADTGLHLPDFRAGERTFQLLTQVAGRTGRGSQPGEVIVQTYNPEHPTIRYAASHDFEGFSKAELELRKGLSFPPYRRLARLLFVGNHENNVESTAGEILRLMKDLLSPSEEILGPAAAPLVKLRGKFRWQAILKFKSTRRAHALILEVLDRYRRDGTQRHGVRIEVDMDPQSLL